MLSRSVSNKSFYFYVNGSKFIWSRNHQKTEYLNIAKVNNGLLKLNICQEPSNSKHFERKLSCFPHISKFKTCFLQKFFPALSKLKTTEPKLGLTLNELDSDAPSEKSLVYRGDLRDSLKHCITDSRVELLKVSVGKSTSLMEGTVAEKECTSVAMATAICNVSDNSGEPYREAVVAKDVLEKCSQDDVVPSDTCDGASDRCCDALNSGTDVNCEMQRTYCDEKLQQFKSKLAAKTTVLPADLLEKTTELVAKCPSAADASWYELEDFEIPAVVSKELFEKEQAQKLEQAVTPSLQDGQSSKSCGKTSQRHKNDEEKKVCKKNFSISQSHYVAVQKLVAQCPSTADAAARYASGNFESTTVVLEESEKVSEENHTQKMEPDVMSSLQDGRSSNTSKTKSKKQEKVEEKTVSGKNSRMPKRFQPSHFVAIQVTNPEIHEKIDKIQKMTLNGNSLLKNALINLPTLHVTLMVMNLKEDGLMERAKVALDDSKKDILALGFRDVQLPFSGIGDFDQTIVFAKVREGSELDHLKKVADTVRSRFAEQSIISTDDREFAPHLTIMKLSKDPRFFSIKKIRKIDRTFYAGMTDEFLGLQQISSLQLCAMKHAANGYYPIEYEVALGADISDEEAVSGLPEISLESVPEKK